MGTATRRKVRIVEPSWYVASCGDGDTHLAESVNDGLVTPRCGGKAFRPYVLLAELADAEQGCPDCIAVREGR
jgi:hypothetical protein